MSKERATALVDAGVFLQLAGDVSGARELFQRALALDPHNAKAQRLFVAAGGVVPGAAAPASPSPLPIQPPAPAAPEPAANSFDTLPPNARARPVTAEAEAERDLSDGDAFLRFGVYDKALESVMRVLRTNPENLAAHEKAYEILFASGNLSAAVDQLVNVLRLLLKLGDAKKAGIYLQTLQRARPDHPELSRFAALLGDPVATMPAGDATLMGRSRDETIIEPSPLIKRPRRKP